MLCTEIQKQNMTAKEVARAFSELPIDTHYYEVMVEIAKVDEDFFKEVGDELFKLASDE
jgi:hypothetical protein